MNFIEKISDMIVIYENELFLLRKFQIWLLYMKKNEF